MADVVAVAIALPALLVMTLGVVGLFRFEDLLVQLHAASKVVVLGVCLLVVAACVAGGGTLVPKAVLVVGLLLLTAPASSHAIARAARMTELVDREDEQPVREPPSRA